MGSMAKDAKVQQRKRLTNYRKLLQRKEVRLGCRALNARAVEAVGNGRESNGFSGISEKIPETEAIKEVVVAKAIAIKELPVAVNPTDVSTSASPNFDRNLVKPEFLCDSTPSPPRPGTSTVFSTRTADPELKYLDTAFHAYPCVSGSKSQCVIPVSSPSVSG
ncbi:hypothetical protein DINM_002117 [Dirofilaria immitis]|nr:hypothetical protein [Dirofilaria immitis]